CTRGSEDFDFW
nr:immunoglobulin heavy chain junction region [Macaca mulatta]MOY21775.1 immunoglobulin heavy chain junction region [Macaca mulatta]MOY21862.1 immunoglobulin heavy chain junction region [Macaca mulatta]MOY22292.1 immunoglobulin heavy chain junction region [Macaca mulatta]MOY25172.1 immunoglobulin heavy chain junction region [Macaca mulatta]